jgi:aryl-alcohol dehydrogenase-like predicted oxidoreductase
MEKRQLGNSDLNITPVGFGAWAIGGGNWDYGWGPQDDQDSIGAIQRALDFGVNWIDTAPAYGLGRSEEIVARALKGRADKPYIFTKCEIRWNENRELYFTLRAESIRQEVEDSLRRLQVDVIDLYQIHWPDPDSEVEEGWTTMAQLQQEGKVRWLGVSNFNVEQMQRAQRIAPITSLQPPYSLLDRGIEKEILPFCKDNNIGVIVYSPMASGLLTGAMTPERVAAMPDDDWRKTSDEFQMPRLNRNMELAALLGRIGERYHQSAGAVAVAWTLRRPVVTGAIVGARRASQVDSSFAGGTFALSDADIAEIESFVRARP